MGQATVYAYDVIGNLTQITDPKGQMKKYAYDDAGRKITETHFTVIGAAVPVKTINYSYNELGTLIGYDDSITSATYTYDNLRRKVQESVNYGAFRLSYGYTYYANSLKKSFMGPDAVIYNYAYDANNQLSSIQLPIGAITINSYQWTAPTQVTLPGGTIRQQQYDSLMRLTSITTKDAFQNNILDYKYSYDKVGNILAKNTEQGNHAYTYDNLYRLTRVTYPNLPTDAYTYDPVGNRLADAQAPGTWTYNQNNQLLTAGTTDFGYDENGNTIQKTDGTQTTQYIYDTNDRLIEVKDTNNVTIARYYYDPTGRRLWKEINNTKIHFLYTDEGLAGEYDQTGVQTKGYGYQPNGTWGTDPIFLKIGDIYNFYQNDHLGTPQKLGTASSAIGWSAIYAAFGATKVDPTSTITNDLRFPGQQFDQETGMHYNWNRYYDPKFGRYVSADPIGLNRHAQGWLADHHAANALLRYGYERGVTSGGFTSTPLELNPYAFVANNPLRWNDPTGEFIAIAIPAICLATPANLAACGAAIAATVVVITNLICKVRDKDKDDECWEKCKHLLPSPSGDLQASEYRKCYRECKGSL